MNVFWPQDQSEKSDMFAKDDKKSKSFEERQERYDRVRARIFNQSVRVFVLFNDIV